MYVCVCYVCVYIYIWKSFMYMYIRTYISSIYYIYIYVRTYISSIYIYIYVRTYISSIYIYTYVYIKYIYYIYICLRYIVSIFQSHKGLSISYGLRFALCTLAMGQPLHEAIHQIKCQILVSTLWLTLLNILWFPEMGVPKKMLVYNGQSH